MQDAESDVKSPLPAVNCIDGSLIRYEDFLSKYLIPNQPCIISKGLVKDWRAFDLLKPSDGKGSHDPFTKLADLYGDHVAPVVISIDDVEEEERKEMSIAEAVKLMKYGKKKVYIKDWHLVRQERQRGNAEEDLLYTTPDIFADDC